MWLCASASGLHESLKSAECTVMHSYRAKRYSYSIPYTVVLLVESRDLSTQIKFESTKCVFVFYATGMCYLRVTVY